MANATTWKKRVEQWRASGKTAKAFCAEEGLSLSSLRNWAYRCGQEERSVSTVRLLPVQAAPAAMEARGNDITVEVGAMRLTVPPGFDRATLAAVLELVGAR